MLGCSLSGYLPSDFNTANPVLNTIQLTGHAFSGQMPASLFKSTSLVKIDLHSNKLQGSLSAAIGNLIHLEYLSAAGSLLQGRFSSR